MTIEKETGCSITGQERQEPPHTDNWLDRLIRAVTREDFRHTPYDTDRARRCWKAVCAVLGIRE